MRNSAWDIRKMEITRQWTWRLQPTATWFSLWGKTWQARLVPSYVMWLYHVQCHIAATSLQHSSTLYAAVKSSSSLILHLLEAVASCICLWVLCSSRENPETIDLSFCSNSVALDSRTSIKCCWKTWNLLEAWEALCGQRKMGKEGSWRPHVLDVVKFL